MNQPQKDLDQLNAEILQCRLCPRLTEYREEVARLRKRAYRDQEYWGQPVPGFGDAQAHVLVVGLAPGAHGSNRTGRMFTGDSSGDFLYAALHRAGFASQPFSRDLNDGLSLSGVFISAVCRCAPPANKPLPSEIANCLPYLEREIEILRPQLRGFVALGRIATDWLSGWYRRHSTAAPKLNFSHALYQQPLEGLPWLITSYHPSRQNTQTGKLTPSMFDQVWSLARQLIQASVRE